LYLFTYPRPPRPPRPLRPSPVLTHLNNPSTTHIRSTHIFTLLPSSSPILTPHTSSLIPHTFHIIPHPSPSHLTPPLNPRFTLYATRLLPSITTLPTTIHSLPQRPSGSAIFFFNIPWPQLTFNLAGPSEANLLPPSPNPR
jgi:hypothetical protein